MKLSTKKTSDANDTSVKEDADMVMPSEGGHCNVGKVGNIYSGAFLSDVVEVDK